MFISTFVYLQIDKDFETLFEDHGGILVDSELKIQKIYKFLKEDNHIKDHTINSVLNSITDIKIERGGLFNKNDKKD